MSKLKIVLVDSDEDYLVPLELKFIKELKESIDIIIITDELYLEKFFSSPQNIDVLIINKELYNSSIEKHNIKNTFLLLEKIQDEPTNNLSYISIYKYSSVKEIYNTIISNLSNNEIKSVEPQKTTKVIMLYSPIGGVGTTTLSCGLAGALSQQSKKVLYIGIDNLQTFGFLFSSDTLLPNGIEKHFASNSEYTYQILKNHICNEFFDYIPPFSRALSSFNIKIENYINLIECIKKSNEYNYIVIDTTSDFTENVSLLMGVADNIIILTKQDIFSVHKLNNLLNNIDYLGLKKFMFICNKYKSDEENFLIDLDNSKQIYIQEYINFFEINNLLSIENLIKIKDYQKLALQFI